MKSIFVAFVFLSFINLPLICFSQKSEKQHLIDQCMDLMKEHAVNAKVLDWENLESMVKKIREDESDERNFGKAIRFLFQTLNDNHGAFYYGDSVFRWNSNIPVASDSILNEWKKGMVPKSMFLDSEIAYLSVPGMPYLDKNDADKKAQELNNHLCDLLRQQPKGLIIDLRLNGGGAMFPMILGLQQLLEKGVIGSFQSKNNERWILTESQFLIDTALMAEINPVCFVQNLNLPIVFLTSPVTGSSAEYLLIAFQGRPNTKVIGTPTAGFLSATQGFQLNENTFLLLSTAYGKDKNGNIYSQAFAPDLEVLSADSFNDLENDEKVKAAKALLLGKFAPKTE